MVAVKYFVGPQAYWQAGCLHAVLACFSLFISNPGYLCFRSECPSDTVPTTSV